MCKLTRYAIASAFLALFLGIFFFACAGTPGSGSTSSGQQPQPEWISSPYSKYSERQFIARTGSGPNLEEAEKSAFANLVGYFGQTIRDEQKISNIYQEAVKNGVTSEWSDTTSIDRTIATSAGLNSLVGAEIRDTWFDGRNTYYAAAVMDRAKTAQIYTDMIKANQVMIGNLVNMEQAEKNTIEGFARYQFAAVVADINTSYSNVLKVTGAAPVAGLKTGDEYRLEAVEITKTIPVRVLITKQDEVDRAGRIQGAFTSALSGFGFRTATGSAPYTLNINLSLSEVQLPNQQNKFARYEVIANFTDSATGIGLLPSYSINGREGHLNLPEAENRAIAAAERKIVSEYADLLAESLSQLLPRR
jgi:hypothetical protein